MHKPVDYEVYPEPTMPASAATKIIKLSQENRALREELDKLKWNMLELRIFAVLGMVALGLSIAL